MSNKTTYTLIITALLTLSACGDLPGRVKSITCKATFESVDTNGDNFLSTDEYDTMIDQVFSTKAIPVPHEVFNEIDKDSDNKISEKEWKDSQVGCPTP